MTDALSEIRRPISYMSEHSNITAWNAKIKNIPQIHTDDLSYQSIIGSSSFEKCFKGRYGGNILAIVNKFKSYLTNEEVLNEAEAMQDIQRVDHQPSLALLIWHKLEHQALVL